MDDAALDPTSPMEALPELGAEWGVAWPDLAAPDGTVGEAAAAGDAVTTERRYRLAIEGLDGIGGAELTTRFAELSTLRHGEDEAANVAQIDRRAREDAETLRALLRAAGHYDADVRPRVESGVGSAPIAVTLAAEPGPLYRFADVDLRGVGADVPALATAFPIAPGDPVDAERVTAAETDLRVALGREGYAFGRVGELDVVVDHATRTATLALDVTPGQAQRFGRLTVADPRPLFSAKHLGRIARFQAGDPYDSALLDDLRRALIATALVSSVRLTPVPAATPGTVDIAVALERAPPRTVAGELGYGTGEGVRAEVSWTHRNLIRPEGAVTFRGVAGTREQLLGASLRRSNYKARDRILSAQIVAAHLERDAYDARTFAISGSLERQTNIIWQKEWTWSVGAEFLASDERDTIRATGEARRRTFLIAAFPGTLAYDGSDDLLNPTRGFRLAGRVSPEASFQNGSFGYARVQLDGSTYLPVTRRASLAMRARVGSIVGAERDRIAPSRRFYAGGGGSVRGYGYQDIGPRDVDNDPIGGRSLAEFALEARVRVGDFGIVPFLDGGNIYTSPLPQLSGFRYGAGIGARYHTSFGPIRVDLGTPLNPRRGDARLAVYVSLGQAF